MLEVHPPHEAVHTWADFFIHIATIIVGLLIAVGLEQTVEQFHRLHQRHQLQHDLHAEAERNALYFEEDDQYFKAKDAQFAGLEKQANEAIASKRSFTIAPRKDDDHIFWTPATAAWESARDSSLLILLSRPEAAMYDDIYSQATMVNTYTHSFFGAFARQRRFEARFNGLAETPSTPISPDQAGKYLDVLIETRDTLQELRFVTDMAREVNAAILNGAHSSEEVERAVRKARTATPPPL